MMVPLDFSPRCRTGLFSFFVFKKNGASRAAKSSGGFMNYTGWIAVAIAVLQIVKESMDD